MIVQGQLLSETELMQELQVFLNDHNAWHQANHHNRYAPSFMKWSKKK